MDCLKNEFTANSKLASRLPTNAANFVGSAVTSIRITTVFQPERRMK
jgi:hypothetical protein